MLWRKLLAVALLTALVGVGTVSAQGTPVPPEAIQIGSTVSDTLTPDDPFAWWEFYAYAGQMFRAQMLTEGGLVPRLGVMDASGEIFVRSDQPGEGITGLPDLAIIEFTAPADGALRLVAGALDQTTGNYRLTLQELENPNDTGALTVTFPCNGQEAAVLAGVQFRHEAGMSGDLRAYLYGEPGMQPVIRVQAPEAGIDLCWDDPGDSTGDQVFLPGGEAITITADQREQAALFAVNASAPLGEVTLTLGAIQPSQGRYLAFFSGESLGERNDNVVWRVRQGPLPAQNSDLQIYMLGTGQNSRLDPFLELGNVSGTRIVACDDAGGRGCEGVPSAQEVGVTLSNGETALGDRFDSGVILPSGNTDWHTITFASFGGNTTGDFAVLLAGQLGDDAAE